MRNTRLLLFTALSVATLLLAAGCGQRPASKPARAHAAGSTEPASPPSTSRGRAQDSPARQLALRTSESAYFQGADYSYPASPAALGDGSTALVRGTIVDISGPARHEADDLSSQAAPSPLVVLSAEIRIRVDEAQGDIGNLAAGDELVLRQPLYRGADQFLGEAARQYVEPVTSVQAAGVQIMAGVEPLAGVADVFVPSGIRVVVGDDDGVHLLAAPGDGTAWGLGTIEAVWTAAAQR